MTNIDLQYKIVSEEQDLSDYQNNSVISDTPQEINKIKNDCDPCKKNIKERPKLNEAVVKCVNKNLEKRIGKVILPCYDNKIKEEF